MSLIVANWGRPGKMAIIQELVVVCLLSLHSSDPHL